MTMVMMIIIIIIIMKTMMIMIIIIIIIIFHFFSHFYAKPEGGVCVETCSLLLTKHCYTKNIALFATTLIDVGSGV